MSSHANGIGHEGRSDETQTAHDLFVRGPIVWSPRPERIEAAGVTRFTRWLAQHRGVHLDGYGELWDWSVGQLEEFWAAIWEFCGVISQHDWDHVLTQRSMPGAVWFPGARLNFAENALQRNDEEPILLFHREDGLRRQLTARELRDQVAAAASGMRSLGVKAGDRVAAILPNCPEAVIAFLATASIGAIWTVCGPESGPRAITERFAQVEPVILITVDGYFYAGNHHDISATVADALRELPSVARHILVSYAGDANPDGALAWDEFTHTVGPLEFAAVPFDHPLWIVYSSGTTGRPKAIVHGHGGIVLEQLKVQMLHQDAGFERRHIALTLASPTWIVWNLLVSYLLTGTTLVLYDGSPLFPHPARIWEIAAERQVSILRASAAWITACAKAAISPGKVNDLSHLEIVLSTASPLPSEAFHWIVEHVGPDVQPASSSGGTEVCTALVTAVSVLPIRAGEIQCKALGVAVAAFDEQGVAVVGEVGELVVTAPMPSMPLYLFNDTSGERLRDAYFVTYPGVWRHGDWIRFEPDGSSVILGRSDASLNRGGVRIGTAEFYRVLEGLPELADSLVVDIGTGGSSGELLLFVVMRPDNRLDDAMRDRIRVILRAQLSPRHVPDRIVEVPDLPYTHNGKKCEVPVKRILLGAPVDDVVDSGALRNPTSLRFFTGFDIAAGR